MKDHVLVPFQEKLVKAQYDFGQCFSKTEKIFEIVKEQLISITKHQKAFTNRKDRALFMCKKFQAKIQKQLDEKFESFQKMLNTVSGSSKSLENFE